jgi:hypothetical protein
VIDREALIGDPLYPQLKEQLIELTGPAYYLNKDIDLASRLERRVHDCRA